MGSDLRKLFRELLYFLHLTRSNPMNDDPMHETPVEGSTPEAPPEQEASDVQPADPGVSVTPVEPSAPVSEPLTPLTSASRPFTALAPSRPTRIGAVAGGY